MPFLRYYNPFIHLSLLTLLPLKLPTNFSYILQTLSTKASLDFPLDPIMT